MTFRTELILSKQLLYAAPMQRRFPRCKFIAKCLANQRHTASVEYKAAAVPALSHLPNLLNSFTKEVLVCLFI